MVQLKKSRRSLGFVTVMTLICLWPSNDNAHSCPQAETHCAVWFR